MLKYALEMQTWSSILSTYQNKISALGKKWWLMWKNVRKWKQWQQKKTERKIQIKVRPDWIWTLQLNCRKPIPKAFDSSGSYTTSKREAYLKGVFEVSSCMFEKDSCKTVLTFSPVLKKKLCWVLSRIVKMVTAMTYEAKHAKSLNLEEQEKKCSLI